MISTFTSFIARSLGCSVPNRVDRTNLSRAWDLRAMARLAVRVTLSGAVRVAASAREGVAPPPTIT